MGRCKTPSYTLEVKLNVTVPQEQELGHRFFLCNKVYNVMVKEARRRLGRYYMNPEVKAILKKRKENKNYEFTQEEKDTMNKIQAELGLTEFDFHTYIKKQNAPLKKMIDANTIQKLASRCWQATKSVLFSNGETVHFRKLEELTSVEGKDDTGIRYRDGYMKWKGLEIPVEIRKNDIYAQMALADSRVKYCRIMRRWHKNHWQYYLQLVLEGLAPAKVDRKTGELKHHAKETVAGLDIGPSTVAVWSPEGILFQEFADDVDRIDREIARLQRKLDRQRRANNPQNYTEDGQIKRLKKGEKRVWNYSKGYFETRNKLRELQRKRKARVKLSHQILANKIIDTVGRTIYIEKMNWKSLQKKAKKKPVQKKTDKPKTEEKKKKTKRKRFGKSILCHAPAEFTSILTQKAKYYGGEVIEIDPSDAKASQYNHIRNTYQKAELNERWKQLTKRSEVQRDLYSAFCLGNLKTEFDKEKDRDKYVVSREKCVQNFKTFRIQHDKLIQSLRKEKQMGKCFPSCMGI